MEKAPISSMPTSGKIADVTISDSQHLWKMLGTLQLIQPEPLFPITVRELLQNSVDAQKAKGVTTPIGMEVTLEENGTVCLVFTDAGVGMDEETIHTKFLALGATGKAGSAVGGFGIAKASIIGACTEWQLRTQDNYLDSSMIGKQPICKMPDWFDGCQLTLKYSPDEENAGLKLDSSVLYRAISYLHTSDCEIMLTVRKGEESWQTKIAPYHVDDKCFLFEINNAAYSAKAYLAPKATTAYKEVNAGSWNYISSQSNVLKGYTIYRINGLTQYSHYDSGTAEFNVVVDVTPTVQPGDGNYPFSTSRETAKQELRNLVESRVEKLFKNPLTTMRKLEAVLNKEPEQKVKHYDGVEIAVADELMADINPDIDEYEHVEREKVAAISEVVSQVDQKIKELPELEAVFINKPKPAPLQNTIVEGEALDVLPKEDITPREISPVAYQMCIKYRNPKTLTTLGKAKHVKILRVWAELIQQVMMAAPEYGHNFSIGFIVNEKRLAERDYNFDYHSYYYLIDPTGLAVSKGQETIMKMFQYAVHEVVHTLNSNHDEAFTSAYHDVCDKYIAKFGFKSLKRLAKLLLTGKSTALMY